MRMSNPDPVRRATGSRGRHRPADPYTALRGGMRRRNVARPGPRCGAEPCLGFLTGTTGARETDRVLATVLFTDIVGATERAATLGDRAWRRLLEEHHEAVRHELDRYRGIEVDTAGDGFMVVFDSPARAIRCAQAVVSALRSRGIEIRAGLHTGECERIDGKLGGIAVHIAARIAASGGPGQVVVSRTLKDIVVGSAIEFADLGERALRGIPEEWRLFTVEG